VVTLGTALEATLGYHLAKIAAPASRAGTVVRQLGGPAGGH
jgi:hypothetical protein